MHLDSARKAFEQAGMLPTITLRPMGGRDWTEAAFGLGPFRAHIILDGRAATARAIVHIGHLDMPEVVEDALSDIRLPRPEVTIPLDDDEPLSIEFSHPLRLVERGVAIGMLGACALYAVALVEQLWDALTSDTHAVLHAAGFRPGRGFGADPRTLLASEPVGLHEREEIGDPDDQERFEVLTDAVRQFVEERAWQEFHTPKNLTMALAGEVGGLLHAFQWLSDDDIVDQAMSGDLPRDVTDHLADTLIYLIRLADVCEIDLVRVGLERAAENELRFPSSDFAGMIVKEG